MSDEITITLSRAEAQALAALAAQLDAMREDREPPKTRTTVAHIVSTMLPKVVESANGAFRAWCNTGDYTVAIEYVCFPEAWRGQGPIALDAPLMVRSVASPALEDDTLYLPGTTRDEDGEPVYRRFNTLSEAYMFYNEKLLPTLEALARLADETLLVDDETA